MGKAAALLLLQLIAVGCSSRPDMASASLVARFDSLVASDSFSTATDVAQTLSDSQKAAILDLIDDPAGVVRAFFDRLPDGGLDGAGPGLLTDTVFRFFPREGGGDETRRAFLRGALMVAMQQASKGSQASQTTLRAIPRPSLEAFLAESLRLPDLLVVREERNVRDAKQEIARAVCRGAQPTIQYSPQIAKEFSPLAFAFVRAHEFAHFALRHVRCDGNRPHEPPIPAVRQRELDADCEAARIVVAKIPLGGTSVVSEAAGSLWTLNWPPQDYPGTRERRDSLYTDKCG